MHHPDMEESLILLRRLPYERRSDAGRGYGSWIWRGPTGFAETIVSRLEADPVIAELVNDWGALLSIYPSTGLSETDLWIAGECLKMRREAGPFWEPPGTSEPGICLPGAEPVLVPTGRCFAAEVVYNAVSRATEIARELEQQTLKAGSNECVVIKTIFMMGAVSPETAQRAEDIVKRAFGVDAEPNNYKRLMSGLVNKGFLMSTRGRGSGYYLSDLGKTKAEQLFGDGA